MAFNLQIPNKALVHVIKPIVLKIINRSLLCIIIYLTLSNTRTNINVNIDVKFRESLVLRALKKYFLKTL